MDKRKSTLLFGISKTKQNKNLHSITKMYCLVEMSQKAMQITMYNSGRGYKVSVKI